MIGTTRITRNIFAGTQDRTENAMAFLDNLTKIKNAEIEQYAGKKLNPRMFADGENMSQASYPTHFDGDSSSVADGRVQLAESGNRYNSESGFESLDPVYEDQESVDEDEVLLNISPNKYEKPKDQLYMDFFCKYTELFVKEKRETPKQLQKSQI